jgi:outer membrane protein TolC
LLTPPPAAPRSLADLHDALDLVRARSADLRVAIMEVSRAEGQSRSALASLLPQLNASASGTHQLITRDTLQPDGKTHLQTPAENSAQLGATLTQSVFSLPLIRARKSALMNEDVQRLSLEDQRRVILSGVLTALVTVVTTERVAELNRVGLKAALERLELAKAKEKLGSATTLDIRRAEQDVESARSQVVNGDETMRQAREALALAVGMTGQVGVGGAVDLARLESDANQICGVVATVDERADVRSQAKKLEITERGIDDVKAQFLPTVSLQSAFGTSASTVTVQAPTTWSVTGVLNVPIWDGGNRYGLMHQAEAVAEEGRVNLEAYKRSSTTGADQAHRAVDVAVASRAVAERAQKLAEEVDKLVQTQYRIGQGTSLDLVTAATAKRQADINLALADFAVARARLVDKLTLASCKY